MIRRWYAIFCVAMFCTLCWQASAEDPIGHISLGGSAGYSAYALGDVRTRMDAGNTLLASRHWATLDPLKRGWTFWADGKIPVPFLNSLFLEGGYGVSSGESKGPDIEKQLSVSVLQKAWHGRLLWVLPWRFQEDTRLFVGGGPLIIQHQEVECIYEHLPAEAKNPVRTERVRFWGSGMGWQAGVAAEYMIQDHLTLALDLGYRSANLAYKYWEVEVTDTDPERANDVPRLARDYDNEKTGDLSEIKAKGFWPDGGYVFRAFFDVEKTEAREGQYKGELGPDLRLLIPVAKEDLHIDMSGFQMHLGLRIYFL